MREAIVLCGKAGTGKSTLSRALATKHPATFYEVISYTTRPPRDGEVNGEHYHFVTEAEFLRLKATGQFVEDAMHDGAHYATSLDWGQEDAGKVPIFVLNTAGAEQIEQLTNRLWLFEIIASDDECQRRLVARGEDAEVVAKRQAWELHQPAPRKRIEILHYNTALAMQQVLVHTGRPNLVPFPVHSYTMNPKCDCKRWEALYEAALTRQTELGAEVEYLRQRVRWLERQAHQG